MALEDDLLDLKEGNPSGQNFLTVGPTNLFVWHTQTKKDPLQVLLKKWTNDGWIRRKEDNVTDVDCSPQELREHITMAFPKLSAGGGFEYLKCAPSTQLFH